MVSAAVRSEAMALLFFIHGLSCDVASESEITPCIKIDNPLGNFRKTLQNDAFNITHMAKPLRFHFKIILMS